MIWDPVFSPDSKKVVAKTERNGKFFVVVNGKPWKDAYDSLWNPVFSPDGEKILVRCIKDGKYYRKVLPVDEA
jgi:Tol biopolymer transport system component